MNEISNWLISNWVEVFGTTSGLLYIYLSIRQSLWLWPVGFITSAAFFVLFYQVRLYADMLLQLYYCLVSIYGWHTWRFGKSIQKGKNSNLPIDKLTFWQWLLSIIIILFLTFLYYPLGQFFMASFPLLDGFVTASSIVATWLLAKKYIDQWLMWILIDILTAILLLLKDKYMAASLMGVYTILAVVGYVKWLKDFKKQSENA